MTLGMRIRMARRKMGISQEALAQLVGVSRSAVANWESTRTNTYPSTERLQRLARETGVSYEWLGTGRGSPTLQDTDIPAVDAELVEDPLERVLLEGFRASSEPLRQGLLAIAESQLRSPRTRR